MNYLNIFQYNKNLPKPKIEKSYNEQRILNKLTKNLGLLTHGIILLKKKMEVEKTIFNNY